MSGRSGGDGGSSIVVSRGPGEAIVEVSVRGQWCHASSVAAYHVFKKVLAERPTAIIVDLDELHDLRAGSASMWMALSDAAASLRPPAQVALCMPPTRQLVTKLRHLGCTRLLSMFVTVDQARSAVMPSSDGIPPR